MADNLHGYAAPAGDAGSLPTAGSMIKPRVDYAAAEAGKLTQDQFDRQIETLRRALAWHGDPQRMATTREEWQQEIDDAIAWVNANPEKGRPSFSSFADPTPAEAARAIAPFARYATALLSRRDGAEVEPVPDDRLVFGIDGMNVTIGDLRAIVALSTEARYLEERSGS